MSDLISREEALKALGDIHPLDYNAQAYKAKIAAIPSTSTQEDLTNELALIFAKGLKTYCQHQKTSCEDCFLYGVRCSEDLPCNWDTEKKRNCKDCPYYVLQDTLTNWGNKTYGCSRWECIKDEKGEE